MYIWAIVRYRIPATRVDWSCPINILKRKETEPCIECVMRNSFCFTTPLATTNPCLRVLLFLTQYIVSLLKGMTICIRDKFIKMSLSARAWENVFFFSVRKKIFFYISIWKWKTIFSLEKNVKPRDGCCSSDDAGKL